LTQSRITLLSRGREDDAVRPSKADSRQAGMANGSPYLWVEYVALQVGRGDLAVS